MATAADIRAWLNRPNRTDRRDVNVYRRNWDQKCQALMWQAAYEFGTAPQAYSSAKLAMAASGALQSGPAPAGAFHYWDYGVYGHVALELGGGIVLMASAQVDEFWATNAGIIDANVYTQRTGLRYRGWAHTNGRNDLAIEGAAAPAPAPVPAPAAAAPTATSYWLDLPVWWYRYDSAADARSGRLRKGYGVGAGSYLITANDGGALQIVLGDGSRTWMHPKAQVHVRVVNGTVPAPAAQSVHLGAWWFSYDSARDAINGRLRKGKGFGPGAYPVKRIENGAVLVSGTPLGDQWLHPKARAFIR